MRLKLSYPTQNSAKKLISGVQPDPGKVSALKQMSSHANRQELQTFLGLENYIGPFIPNLSTLTAPLRELLKEDNRF